MHDGRVGQRSGPECLIGHPESSARISEARSEFNGGARRRAGWTYRPKDPQRLVRPKMLALWRVNPCAVAAAHQDAILGFAHIRDAHGKPYSDGH